MALTERLALLVTLDAKGAVQGLNDIGRAADKNLGKAESKVEQSAAKFKRSGAAMLAGAGLAAAGLYKAGQAAADLEQAVGGTEAVFKDASGAIDKYAKNADQKMGLSERAFREATTSIGGQLKGVGFTIDESADQAVRLTQVAADLAATYGGTTADAVSALGSAFRGEADPAERFNLRLNQNTVNAKAVALGLAESTANVDAHAKAQATLALIMEQSSDAQGQFAREADTAAGAQARLTASLENLKANLGVAIAPIIGDIADGLGGLTDGFNALPDSAQQGISKVAAFGTVALGVAGSISFIIGKAQDFRGRLADLATTAPRTSAALRGIATAAGTLGILATVGQWIDDAFSEDHTGDINKLENALVRLSQGAALDSLGVDLEAAADGLNRVGDPSLGDRIEDVEDKVWSLGGLLGDSNVHLNDAKEAVNGLDGAIAQLAARDPELAAQALNQFAEEFGLNVEEIIPQLHQYESTLAGVDTETRTAAGGVGDLTGEIDDQTTSVDDATKAIDGYLDAVRASVDPLFAMWDALQDNADANAALEEAMANGETSTRDLERAHTDAAKSALEVEEAALRLAAAVDAGTVSLDSAEAMLDQWVAKGLISVETASQMKAEFRLATREADELAGDRAVTFTSNIDVFAAKLGALNQQFAETPRYVPVDFEGPLVAGQERVTPAERGRGANDITNNSARGGLVPDYLASGGFPGGPQGSDVVPSWLTPGEFVMRKESVDKYGLGLMQSLNSQRFASGGPVLDDLYRRIGEQEGKPAEEIRLGGGGYATPESLRLRMQMEQLRYGPDAPSLPSLRAAQAAMAPAPVTTGPGAEFQVELGELRREVSTLADAVANFGGDVFHFHFDQYEGEDNLSVMMRALRTNRILQMEMASR